MDPVSLNSSAVSRLCIEVAILWRFLGRGISIGSQGGGANALDGQRLHREPSKNLKHVRRRCVSKLPRPHQSLVSLRRRRRTHHRRQRTQDGQDSHAEVGDGAELVDLAFLELFFGEREESDLGTRLLGRVLRFGALGRWRQRGRGDARRRRYRW